MGLLFKSLIALLNTQLSRDCHAQKMNKIITVLFTLLPIILLTCITKAQTKDAVEFVKRIPVYRWTDDQHLIVYRGHVSSPGDLFSVNILTGETQKAGKEVVVRPKFTIKKDGTLVIPFNNGKSADTIKSTTNAQLSPDSSYFAYTRNRNLFVFNLKERKEYQLSNDGSETIYNGYSSWVYNEEILGRGTAYRAFWWSPDSKNLAFMHFDDAEVPIYYMTDDSGIHQKQIAVRYPLPGDKNPEVKIGVANMDSKSTVWSKHEPKTDQYFGMPIWTPTSELWLQWMNRKQDNLKVQRMDLTTGAITDIYSETQKTWISLDQENRITFIPRNNSFLRMSDKDGWMHLYLHQNDGKLIKQLTTGNWNVKEIQYIDTKTKEVFFTGTRENSTRTDLYKVNLVNGKNQRLTFGPFNHTVSLSPNAKYFTTIYSNFITPAKLAVVDRNGKLIKVLDSAKGKDFDQYVSKVQRSEIIRIKTPDGFDLPVKIIFPAQLDSTKKYPLLANVYGGPNSQGVSDGFYANYLGIDTGEKDLIKIQMDHRGSGQFGKVGQDYLYHNLGKWEIEDYTTIINYLKKKYPFIDSTRLGISGFSYGGYISALALTKAPNIFTVALAGGSVTDWRFYDSVYTERYMGTPAENPEGYKSSSVFTYVNRLKGHLRLAQGTMDDNVHMRNTMKLVDALMEADKKFDVMFYPGGAHGWYYLHHKALHYNSANAEFIKTYLLKK